MRRPIAAPGAPQRRRRAPLPVAAVVVAALLAATAQLLWLDEGTLVTPALHADLLPH